MHNIAYTQWLVYCILQGFSPAQTSPRFDSRFARNQPLGICTPLGVMLRENTKQYK